MIKNKEIIHLLLKHKDEESFIEAYVSSRPIITRPLPSSIEEMETQLSEEFASGIDKEILAKLFWMSKDDILKYGLREDKLKRILKNEKTT